MQPTEPTSITSAARSAELLWASSPPPAGLQAQKSGALVSGKARECPVAASVLFVPTSTQPGAQYSLSSACCKLIELRLDDNAMRNCYPIAPWPTSAEAQAAAQPPHREQGRQGLLVLPLCCRLQSRLLLLFLDGVVLQRSKAGAGQLRSAQLSALESQCVKLGTAEAAQ